MDNGVRYYPIVGILPLEEGEEIMLRITKKLTHAEFARLKEWIELMEPALTVNYIQNETKE